MRRLMLLACNYMFGSIVDAVEARRISTFYGCSFFNDRPFFRNRRICNVSMDVYYIFTAFSWWLHYQVNRNL